MLAMILEKLGEPLRAVELPMPEPGNGQIRIRVHACGVCRTDLHIVDGELPNAKLPVIPGHEIVGVVDKLGGEVDKFQIGDRVGVPWLGWTCGKCRYCTSGRENLCDYSLFTGYNIDGGYAQYAVAGQRYCFAIPEGYSDIEAAPLLCAGLIGYRSLKMTGDAKRIGFYGFGAAAHLIAQVAAYQKREVYAFTKPRDIQGQAFARSLGAVWAGGSDEEPPTRLDAAIIFAPVGALVPTALKALAKGGTVVCAGIHMSDIPSFSYDIIWGERSVRSVANLTRADGEEFLANAPKIPIRTLCQPYALNQANEALNALREGRVGGAAVLVVP